MKTHWKIPIFEGLWCQNSSHDKADAALCVGRPVGSEAHSDDQTQQFKRRNADLRVLA
jgi:hypothetical protein